MEYQFTKEMREISGFGGGYEDCCRRMIVAGAQWCDSNPDAKLTYKEFKNITGLTTDESPDMKKMQEAMNNATGEFGATGAMMQAAMSHVMFVRKNGWAKYVEEMIESNTEVES